MAQASEQTSVCQGESPFKLTPIWSLSDDLLSKIFSYLKPNERFRLADVCSRWAGVSRMDWTEDIIGLDLSPISKENLGSIIQLCPKLQSITAQDCELNVTVITGNLRSELKSLHLYRVSAHAGLLPSPEDPHDGSPNAFLLELQRLTHLEELVLSELPLDSLKGIDHFVWDNLPGSLKRLQLNTEVLTHQSGFLQQVEGTFGTIDCLILDDDLPQCAWNHEVVAHVCRFSAVALFGMHQLRELKLDIWLSFGILPRAGNAIVRELSRLEVLSVQLINANTLRCLVPLVNSHPTLRILIIAGTLPAEAGETLIPPRRRYPNGLGSDPLPLLHVFIGGQIAQKIRFARAANDALEVHPITLPMPQFLEQPEVAEIFKGSWIAEMIKKGAKANSRLWDYDARIAQSVLVLNPGTQDCQP